MSRFDICVRCGSIGPRYADSWLCSPCYKDPRRITEQRAVEAAAWSDYKTMRKMLREQFGWTGGWGRREIEGQP